MKILLRLTFVLAILTVSLHAQSGASHQNDPKIGKWKQRVAAPASGTREYEDRGCGVTLSTRQGVTADGRRYFSQYAVQFDGKDYPRVVRGSDVANTIAVKWVDAYTMAFTLKEDGTLISEGTTTVSKDGKVLTVATRRAGASGPGGVEIYDRVP